VQFCVARLIGQRPLPQARQTYMAWPDNRVSIHEDYRDSILSSLYASYNTVHIIALYSLKEQFSHHIYLFD
jgi:hypothetical protein